MLLLLIHMLGLPKFHPSASIAQLNDVQEHLVNHYEFFVLQLILLEFDQVLLAGAFGSHLDPYYVADLDIIPSANKEQIRSVGNAAGIGATMALLDVEQKQRIINEIRLVNKIESANEPKFQEYFVDAMALPNKTDQFPQLFAVVKRPQAKAAQNDTD